MASLASMWHDNMAALLRRLPSFVRATEAERATALARIEWYAQVADDALIHDRDLAATHQNIVAHFRSDPLWNRYSVGELDAIQAGIAGGFADFNAAGDGFNVGKLITGIADNPIIQRAIGAAAPEAIPALVAYHEARSSGALGGSGQADAINLGRAIVEDPTIFRVTLAAKGAGAQAGGAGGKSSGGGGVAGVVLAILAAVGGAYAWSRR